MMRGRADVTYGSVLEEGDEVAAFVRSGDAKVHIVVGNERIRAAQPLIQRRVIPDHAGALQSVGVGEVRHCSGLPSEDSSEFWSFSSGTCIHRMTACAALFKHQLSARWICGRE